VFTALDAALQYSENGKALRWAIVLKFNDSSD